MKSDLVYNFMILLLIFIIIELSIAVTNQIYVPLDKQYKDLTPTQKILVELRFYFNIIETVLLSYTLFNYSEYLNGLTILLLVSILIACFRYFLFGLGLIYHFVNKTKKNTIIVDFIEDTLGKYQNIGIIILLTYIIVRIYFYKIY
jgi:hypothetical protein